MGELSHRARRILYAVVTEFIATGDPVGSRILSKKYGLGLSAATIRNVLSDLEEAGYLHQPHVSAGRVPSSKALRFFIDALMKTRPLSGEEHSAIEKRFDSLTMGTNWLRESGRFLSELTGTAAVVLGPKLELRTLVQFRFIPTRVGQMLAVIVLSDGTVENRFISVDQPITESELTRIHNLLAEVTQGRTLGEVRELLAHRMQDDRHEIDSLRRQAFDLGRRAVGDTEEESDVLIEGQVRLLEQPEFSDADRMRRLVLALADQKTLLALLDRTIQSREIQIYVGSETGDLAGGTLSVVAAPYTELGRAAGTIGVLGPTRMDYPKVVPLVEATADAMSAALDRAHREGESPKTP